MAHLRPHPSPVSGTSRAPASVRGFTLVELMVTVAIAAVLLVIAVPSFTLAMNTNRLAALTNDMVTSLQIARMEAIRRGVPVSVCGSTDGATCAADENWTGWIVFADLDRDDTPDAGEVLRAETVKAPLQLMVSDAISGASGNAVRFRPDGLARRDDGGLLEARIATCLETTQPAENVRLVRIASGSRVSTAPVAGGGACNAPSDTD